MNTRLLLTAALACSLAFAPIASAQEKGYWRASSTTARSITGDIAFSGSKITINFASFTIAQLVTIGPTQATAVFGSTIGAGGTGNIYTLNIPGDKQFLRHNTLCGADAAQYIVTYVTKHDLQLAIFSGAAMPTLTPEALASATNLCGTYSYIR